MALEQNINLSADSNKQIPSAASLPNLHMRAQWYIKTPTERACEACLNAERERRYIEKLVLLWEKGRQGKDKAMRSKQKMKTEGKTILQPHIED